MDNLRKAFAGVSNLAQTPKAVDQKRPPPPAPGPSVTAASERHFPLDRTHLEANRIVGYDIADRRSAAFDMLRTQVVQEMDAKNWRMLAITSPTAGCGKTLTACNLALSMTRLPERPVLLVDLDFRRPHVAASLGLPNTVGLVSVLQKKASLQEAVVQAAIDRYRLDVLIAEQSVPNASEWIASRAMKALLETLRRDFAHHLIIVDTPPMLATDDVLNLLPEIDCVLLVGAVGTSTVSDIEHCKRHLQAANIVRVVLNKVREGNRPYYG
jgi:capsular exopolysaccharide synthesis family protein